MVFFYRVFCACVWGLTYHSNLKRLVTLQKRAVSMISRSAFDAHTDPIFKSLKLLKFENIIFPQVAKIMYIYKNGQLPESFKNMFFTGREIHNYNTRNKNFFRLPSCRTNVRKFSLWFQESKRVPAGAPAGARSYWKHCTLGLVNFIKHLVAKFN